MLSDPIVEYYKQFVDRAQLRENLKLSVDQRMGKLREMAAAVDREGKRKQAPLRPTAPWPAISDCGPDRVTDPIIELYKRDVDRTLLRENLKLSVEQRMQKLVRMARLVKELRSAGQRARQSS
ncbi:MAG TPA: hypothetical protein VGM76_18295 [Lacipirellulaceae bacterium]|jgi:hypothetical protein